MSAESDLPEEPKAWEPAPYNWGEGDDPALDTTSETVVDPTTEFVAPRVADVAVARGATRGGTDGATLATWVRWALSPHDTPHPDGLLIPGTHAWRGAVHLGQRLHSWGYDYSAHPDHWKLEALKPVYATRPKEYEERQAEIRAAFESRQKTLTYGVIVAGVGLVLTSAILFLIGAVLILLVGVAAIVAGVSVAGRVAATRGGPRVASVAEGVALDVAEGVAVIGREEIQLAFIAAGVIGKTDTIEVTPPRLQRGNGWATTVTLPRGTTGAEAVAKLSKVAGAFDTVDQLVTMTPDAESNRRVWLWVAERDPLTGMAPSSPLATVAQVNVWNGIPFGDTIQMEPVRVAAAGTHWLTVGASGSGKSRSFGLVPMGYALDPYTQMILLDPEGFGAWAVYRPVAEVIQGSGVEDLRAMARRLDRIVQEEFPRRQAVIDHIMATEPKLLPNNEIDAKISRIKRYGLPATFIGVEEAVALYSCSFPYDPSDTSNRARTIGQVAEAATTMIQLRGRKYAISIGLVSQKATTDLLPSAITFGATTRFMLGCTSDTQATSVIPGWQDLGMAPRKLKQAKPNRPGSGNPGAGYLMGVGLLDFEDWVLLRSHYMDGNEIADRMAHARELREKVWPELLPDYVPPAPAEPEPAQRLEPDDPQHLRNVIATFRGGEDALRSVIIVERLQADHPGLYAQLTERGMNAFLKPFGLWTVKVGATGHKGLQLYEVENALREIEAPGDESGATPEDPRT